MENIHFKLFIALLLLSVYACTDGVSPTGEHKSEDINLENILTSSSLGTAEDYTITGILGGGSINLDADGSNLPSFEFNIQSGNMFDMTNPMSIISGNATPSNVDGYYNPEYQAYTLFADQMQFNGSSIIRTLNGVNTSSQLSNDDISMINIVQDGLNDAASFSGGTGPPPILTSSNQSSIPIVEMSDKDVKEMLQEKGYKVKNLGGRLFEITKRYKKKEVGNKLEIVSIFDANTGKIDEEATQYYDGKESGKHAIKRNSNGDVYLVSGSKNKGNEAIILKMKKNKN